MRIMNCLRRVNQWPFHSAGTCRSRQVTTFDHLPIVRRRSYNILMYATLLPPHFSLLFSPFLLLWLGTLGVLIWACIRLRDTTLAWPLAWCVGAWLLFTQAMLFLSQSDFPQYVAAVAAITPSLAMLGAKRPQNGAWQFIVVTLVGVLLFPILRGYAFGNYRTDVHPLFRWLIAIHIVVGVVNHLATRYAIPALLIGAAQYFICSPYLPFATNPGWGEYYYAMMLIVGGCYSATWIAMRGPAGAPIPGTSRLWRDFRDAYGLVWGLRVAERLNAAAAKHRWRVEFTWSGIVGDPHSELRSLSGELLLVKLDPEVRHRVERELRSMMRRFVSHDWIARRLHGEPGA
jgi:hypothetical protein